MPRSLTKIDISKKLLGYVLGGYMYIMWISCGACLLCSREITPTAHA